MTIALSGADWLLLLGHFLSLSLLAVGGAITTAPEMHRLMVDQHRWLSDAQFTLSVVLAQAAPGPNALYVVLIGWHVGLNAGGGAMAGGAAPLAWALAGAMLALFGTLAPSCTLTYLVARWGHRNRELRAVRAFKSGLAPLVIALLVTTAWLLIAVHADAKRDWPLWLLAAVVAALVWRTRVHLLWLIGAGALMGALGWLG
jgi:chromate transporter